MGENGYKKFYEGMVPSKRSLSEFDDDELERYSRLMERDIEENS